MTLESKWVRKEPGKWHIVHHEFRTHVATYCGRYYGPSDDPSTAESPNGLAGKCAACEHAFEREQSPGATPFRTTKERLEALEARMVALEETVAKAKEAQGETQEEDR